MGMFDDAKTLKTAKPAKKSDRVEITTPGLEGYTAVDSVIKSLTALKSTLADDMKSGPMTDHFINAGLAQNSQPVNYRGVEGDASASLEMRRRSSSAPLTEDEIDLLNRHQIPTETVVDTVETFVINPEYLTNPKIMSQIEEALKKVKGLPDDLFLKQEGKSKTIVAETALDELFKPQPGMSEKTRHMIVEDLFPVLTVLAIKPTQGTDDLAAAFKTVEKLLIPTKAKAKA